MITSKFVVKAKKQSRFPAIYQFKKTDLTVLFLNKCSGVVLVSSDEKYKTGSICYNWLTCENAAWRKVSNPEITVTERKEENEK